MTKISNHSPVDYANIGKQPGGFPPKEKMTNPPLNITLTKRSWNLGLSFINGFGRDKTKKTDGDKNKIAQNWRKYDLPPNKLNPMSEHHLKAMMGRMEERNKTLVPDQARRVIQQAELRMHHLADQRAAEAGGKMNEALDHFRAQGESSTSVDQLMTQFHGLRDSIDNELNDVQRELEEMATGPEYRAAQKDAGVPMEKLRSKAETTLTALDGEIVSDQAKTQYAQAREDVIGTSLNKFLDAYCALREHDADQTRATALATILPAMARQLELPAKYLEGLKAVDVAEKKLRNDGLSEEEIQREMPAIRDALVGRRVRDLTAGRTSEMPGKPPTQEEAKQWTADAAALRNLANDYSTIVDMHKETTPTLKERANAMKEQCMNDLIEHLPSMDKMSPQQREETRGALSELAEKLRMTSGDTLHKDSPMAPFQLMHIVSMAEAVTDGDPQRSIDIYKALTSEHVHTALDGYVDRLNSGTAATQLESDMSGMWQMGAHQLPDTVGSLLAANPANGGVDWRDVQSFWRCAKEHEQASATENGDATHMERMKGAMSALRDELVEDKMPEPGSPEKRHWAMAKSAVWQQDTLQHVEQTLAAFPAIVSLPGTMVEMAHDRYKDKGRGDVMADARTQFKGTLENLKGFAEEKLNSASTAQQREAASTLLAMSDYMSKHRGSVGKMTQLRNKLTGKEGSFNSGKEIWSNNLGAKEKGAILTESAKLRDGQSTSAGPAADPASPENLPFLNKLDERHSALDLLKEAVSAMGEDAADMMKEVQSIEDAVKLAQGGKLEGPDAIRRFLHDAIDRTQLGDRMDTINAQQFKISVPFLVPLPVGALTTTAGIAASSGVIVNVQANNDCVQLTLGRMEETSGSQSVAYGLGDDLLPQAAQDALDDAYLEVRLPGISLKSEQKNREDPAIVLKYSIEPKDGLRDMEEAREALKKAVDLMADWKPGEMVDSHGQPYVSVFEAMCDKLDPPPTIDDEVRKYTTVSYEGAVRAGRLAVKLGDEGDARAGLSATMKVTKNDDVMESVNQQGARERYEVSKQTLKGEVLVGVHTPHTTVKEDDKKNETVSANGETKTPKKSLFGFPINVGLSGAFEANIGGKETKYKFPVGTDKYKAYKLEYGDYSRDMEKALDMFLETLPPVASRVQEVIDKGFRKPMEAKLADKVEDKLRQELKDGTLQESDKDSRRTELKKALVDKELGKMEAEVMMDFARALMEEKTDRYSYKLESRQQWAHRGIDAAIKNAEDAGDVDMANLMRQIDKRVFEGDKDQAVKYLIAAGDSVIKKNQLNGWNVLTTHRQEAKSMKEDPLPDTRTATLVPTAERLIGERVPTNPLTDLQKRIVKASLNEVRGNGETPPRATPQRSTEERLQRFVNPILEQTRPGKTTIPKLPTIVEEENSDEISNEDSSRRSQWSNTSNASSVDLEERMKDFPDEDENDQRKFRRENERDFPLNDRLRGNRSDT